MTSDGAVPSAFPPTRFDDYDVLGPLGSGGMGAVFLGRDRMLERAVALKFILADAPDPRARERFLDEARAIARLHHPNVVGIYRIGFVDGRPYLAYELVPGEPLHQLARPVPWRRGLELALGISRGLAAVHASGVLHRDIKPSNIVVGPDDTAKLIDFGLARRLDPFAGGEPATHDLGVLTTDAARTSIGKIAGTPMYMAPELWTGAAPSAQSDLYALGLVIWELLAGDLPRAITSAAEAAIAAQQPAPAIAGRRPELPAPLAELVDACVAVAADARPGSAAELRDRLEAIRAIYTPLVGTTLDGDRGGADAIAGSFARATATGDRFSARFYERAFELDPSLRPMFPDDLTTLRRKVVGTLHTVIRNARSPELLVPLLEDLGERHARYGVQAAHFDTMGQSLLAALAEADAAAWTPALEALWVAAYQQIAAHMGRGLARAAEGSAPALVTPPLTRQSLAPPEPRYARSGDAMIAYQAFGPGPRDVLLMTGWVSHLELIWQQPAYAAFLARLARRARVILYDRRGTGLSDRDHDELALDVQLADAMAVLDAVGAERPAVIAIGDATATAAVLAASHPERVRGLVLYGGSPGGDGARDALEARCEQLRTRWGEPVLLDELAPSRAADPAFRAWWARLLRSGVSSSGAVALLRAAAALDVHAALPAVRTPTLVLHRTGDRAAPVAGGRALARLIPGAQLRELPGDDHLPFTGAPDELAGPIEAFLADMPTVVDGPARLTTVLIAHGDPATLRQAIGTERGTVLSADAAAVVAMFDVPAAAIRAARAARATSAAVHAAVVPTRGDEADLIDAARTAASLAAAGTIALNAAARDLAGAGATAIAIAPR